MHTDDGCGSCECGVDPEFSEVLMNSKVEATVNEYNELLATQLQNQRIYFESLLQEVEEETKRDIYEAVEKALPQNPKLQKMQAKLDKCMDEKKFIDDASVDHCYDNVCRSMIIFRERRRSGKPR